ncbi:MFS transporter [Amycolatopsis sp. A133]|uniref:MFS transporter n=1 Tax=Amycolatopsis sp. A133 TaxID=3064472 RepID=UPI0027ECFFBD|nr:MFS transporter [Amycolatopsis sp. A133]MDQ7806772.1 MFS transporter [Amycolatopsis sp. A133]
MVNLAPGFVRNRWQRSVLGRFPGLGKLTVSSLLSETADEFASVALIWIVLVETGSPGLAGLAVLFRRAPEIVSGPLLGAWFDRWSPVKLTAIGFAVRGIAIGGIALLSVVGTFSVPVVLGLCLVMGVTNPLAKVGTRVITPLLIPRRELHVANGVLTIGDQFPYLVGPVLGGSLAGFIGIWSLFIPAVMCLAATLLVLGVRVNPAAAPPVSAAVPAKKARNGFVTGFGPLITVPVVRAMMILTVIYFLSYGPLLTAVPVFAEQNLGAGGAGYGAMWSAMGVGALLGLVMVPRLARFRPAVVNAVGATVWGLILLPLVLVHTLPLALVIMFVGGFVWAPYASTEISVIQNAVTAEQYGAVFGARRSVIVASSPTGAALGGLLLEHLSAAQVVALSGFACVVGGALCLCLPSVRATKPVPEPEVAVPAKPEPEPEPV